MVSVLLPGLFLLIIYGIFVFLWTIFEESLSAMIFFFISIFFYMPFVGILGYELGKYIFDINLVKWGLFSVFIITSLYPVIIFGTLFSKYSTTSIRLITLTPLFIGIGYALFLVEGYFFNNNTLNTLIKTYTDFFIWLYGMTYSIISSIINWAFSS